MTVAGAGGTFTDSIGVLATGSDWDFGGTSVVAGEGAAAVAVAAGAVVAGVSAAGAFGLDFEGTAIVGLRSLSQK
jgi:hypothetical protein